MVEHSIAHSLELAEARQLIDRAFAHYHERYPKYEPSLHWQDDAHGEIQVSVRGYKLKARLELSTGQATVKADLPLLLRPFQGIVKNAIDREATRWLRGETQA